MNQKRTLFSIIGTLVMSGLVGCSNISIEQFEEVRATAESARTQALNASAAAQSANRTAERALRAAENSMAAANSANRCCSDMSDRMDRAVERAMSK